MTRCTSRKYGTTATHRHLPKLKWAFWHLFTLMRSDIDLLYDNSCWTSGHSDSNSAVIVYLFRVVFAFSTLHFFTFFTVVSFAGCYFFSTLDSSPNWAWAFLCRSRTTQSMTDVTRRLWTRCCVPMSSSSDTTYCCRWPSVSHCRAK